VLARQALYHKPLCQPALLLHSGFVSVETGSCYAARLLLNSRVLPSQFLCSWDYNICHHA
jgi:hypothetical protein